MKHLTLAVDIGASSGRVIIGKLEDKSLKLEEIHRFENGIVKKKDENGNLRSCWEVDRLYQEILNGIEKAANRNLQVESLGIDTWAVDFVLLDAEDKVLGNTVSYRSHRTDSVMEDVFEIIPELEIYKRTGIQFLQFNTIYQLYVLKKENPEYLDKAESFLMIPDYFNYLLTGKKRNEYSNATSTQLFNVEEEKWDEEIMDQLGIPADIFSSPVKPGIMLGELRDELKRKTGIEELKVIAPATHDTGSAVASVPASSEDYAYISSGTWSLMGIESKAAINTEAALKYNFTNEGGAYGTVRFLKNIMGLWLIQQVKKELNDEYSFDELDHLAEAEQKFKYLIDPNDDRFLNPDSMIEAVQGYCRETDQEIPQKPGELVRCILDSLALQYRQVLEELGEVTEREINKIHIIGGGVKNEFLNQLTADITGLEVYAGPAEATAIGNLLVQYITLGYIQSIQEARKIVRESFAVKKYTPNGLLENLEEAWIKYKELQNYKEEI